MRGGKDVVVYNLTGSLSSASRDVRPARRGRRLLHRQRQRPGGGRRVEAERPRRAGPRPDERSIPAASAPARKWTASSTAAAATTS
jgi:hypothetical protein